MSNISHSEHADVNLDSDEIDSDGALDEDLQNHSDANLDEPLSDELGLSEGQPSLAVNRENVVKIQKPLKRKITYNGSLKEKPEENKSSKKIVLKRPSLPLAPAAEDKAEDSAETSPKSKEKVRITADLDTKTRLEMRAKKFGLPVKLTDEQRKEARKQRFGQIHSIGSTNVSSDYEKLKKRSERFGQSVSKLMTDIENKEKLEKRKAKFANV